MKSSHLPEHEKYALIGAGPAGLAGARNLQRLNIPFAGFEAHIEVGGLWDISNPRSTMYESAHLISSKKMTEFKEFPMAEQVPDYPSHVHLREYFHGFARHFNLHQYFHFNTTVTKVEPAAEGWNVTLDTGETRRYRGVIIANGTLAEPNVPNFKGKFAGELLHSAKYKSAALFAGKRVLIIGAGNSGCDLAVDAVHHAKSTAISVRRGYHFVPKYILGRPADSIGGAVQLPAWLKQRVDAMLLKLFIGNPQRYGFPQPDHKLYESHPIVNSLVLYHLGHGDIRVKPDVSHFEGEHVCFVDGSREAFDLVLLATGYKLHYPFIAKEHLCWNGAAPRLYLNTFHPERDNLFVLGMIEAAGLGWQGRYEQAELVTRFIRACEKNSPEASRFRKIKRAPLPNLSGGYRYLKLERMAYYVHKSTYLALLRKHLKRFRQEQPEFKS